mmetsp:Transcript_22950/g.23897  ORF Transcript_22950/g.23897 Transcript_22950/m.23897 type:complete len:88 (-) Transcript_22950:372-635(-)
MPPISIESLKSILNIDLINLLKLLFTAKQARKRTPLESSRIICIMANQNILFFSVISTNLYIITGMIVTIRTIGYHFKFLTWLFISS